MNAVIARFHHRVILPASPVGFASSSPSSLRCSITIPSPSPFSFFSITSKSYRPQKGSDTPHAESKNGSVGVTQKLPAYASYSPASWVTLCVGLVCVRARGPPSLTYYRIPRLFYSQPQSVSGLSLFVLVSLICVPFSSPSRSMPRFPTQF